MRAPGVFQDSPSEGPRVLVDLAPLWTASAFQGIGRYLRELLCALAELEPTSGRDLAVLGLDTRTWPWRTLSVRSVRDFLAAPPREPAEFAENRLRQRFAGFFLREAGCACYHQPEPRHTPLYCGVPLVVTFHDLLPLQFPRLYSRRAPYLRLALNWTITRFRLLQADHVITVSHHVARLLATRFSLAEERITPIWQGVDHTRFSPNREDGEREQLRQMWGLEPPYWLFVGTGDPRKNLPFLVEALAAADLSVPLVLVGKLHPLHEPPIRDAIRRHGVADRVILLGYVEDRWLPTLYRHALALLLPSLGEGFGLPVVEAMACGTPVVAFANSSIPEVAGDAAWLVPTNDLEAFVEAMRVLARNPEKRQELVARGLARARLFTWEKTAQSVLSVYRKVLGLPE